MFSKRSKKVVPHRSSSPKSEFQGVNPMYNGSRHSNRASLAKINEKYQLRKGLDINHGLRGEREMEDPKQKMERIKKLLEVSNTNSKKYTSSIKSPKGGRRRKTAKKYKRTSK
jgi:hypothetical protein